jgi:phospholipid/cholesterol/gamma-HCH transport system ATP-binding protein
LWAELPTLYLFCEPNSGLDPNTAILIDNLIKEITEEYDITTVINDMNSVMEIGERILFLKDGLKAWEGTKEEIFRTDNQSVIDFVYSSNLFKKVREAFERVSLSRTSLNPNFPPLSVAIFYP